MKISSRSGNDWISISIGCDTQGYSSIEMEAFLTHGISSFHAKQLDLQFFKISQFVDALDKFITDRSLMPKLEGTYDSFLSFRAIGSTVRLEFAIGDEISSKAPTVYCLRGAFDIDQSYLNDYVRDFRLLAHAA